MIADAGFCDVTGLTHSLGLEGITFITSLASPVRETRAADQLNVLHQRHELSKKPAKRAVIFAQTSWFNRTMAILPAPHASPLHPAPDQPAARTSRVPRRDDVAGVASNRAGVLRVPAHRPASPFGGRPR